VRAILVKIAADVRRRRLQTALVAVVALLASCTATVSLTLLVRSTAPFEEAFERASGPHLILHPDAARVSAEQLRATASLPVVVAAGDPHPIAFVPIAAGDRKTTVELVGRDDPGGRVDRLELVAGRWVQGPGEMVVTRFSAPEAGELRIQVGETVHVLSRADRPAFRVVGEVVDVGEYSGDFDGRAWVRSDQLSGLADVAASPPGYEMAYRVRDSRTEDGLNADAAAIEAALPAGSDPRPPTLWLVHMQGVTWALTLLSSTLLAFTAFTLVACALIVANTITGAVIATRREIGVMKAIGYSPSEVALVYVGQLVTAALAGSVVGVLVGIAASKPLLEQGVTAKGLPPASPVYLPADLGVLAGTLLVVAAAALVPSVRAASTNAVQALAVGTGQAVGGRDWLGRALQRLRLPRPVSLGVDDAFLRPTRAVLTVTALVIGVATIAFAVGTRSDVESVLADRVLLGTNYDVRLDRFGAYPDSSVAATLSGRRDVAAVVGVHQAAATIPGIKDPMPAMVMRGDTTGLSYRAYQGRWFQAPGEVLLRPVTMQEAHLQLGDAFPASIDGHQVRLKVVGAFTDFAVYDGRGMVLGSQTYADVVPEAPPDTYLVKLRPGANATAVASSLQGSQPDFLKATAVDPQANADALGLSVAVLALPPLLLVVLAMVSVFNTMVLNSRERSFDIAVLKAVGMGGAQVMAMVVAPAVLLGLVGVALGLPAGMRLHDLLVRSMVETIGGVFDTSRSFGALELVVVTFGGVVTAVVGALLPAWWAARASVVTVLRAE
jgi:putative ABC transport system permease protein